MTGTETKLACIKQVSFLNTPLDYFQNTFLNSLPLVNKGLIGRKFLGNFRPLPDFGNVINFLPSKALENGSPEGSD
jgi:hypothetical protein